MRLRFFFLILLFLMAFVSCERDINIQLNRAEAQLSLSSDTSLWILRNMEVPKSKRLQARYSLLEAKALYKSFIDTMDLSVIAPAARYYLQHGTIRNKMETLYYMGCIQQNKGDFADAVFSLTEAHHYAEQIKDYFTEGLICATLSILYNQLHDYSEQLLYARNAVMCFDKGHNKNYRQYAEILMGIAYHNQRLYKEAESLYQEVLQQDPDSVNLQDARAHLALTKVSQWDLDVSEADSLFSLVLQETGSLPTQNMWGAYAYVNDILDRRREADAIYARLDTTNLVNYGWFARSLYSRGQYRKAYDCLSSSILHQSDILNVALTQAVQKMQKEKIEEVKNHEKSNREKQRLLYLLVIVFIVGAAGVLYWRWRCHYYRVLEENHRLTEMVNLSRERLEEIETHKPSEDTLQNAYIRLFQSQFREIGVLYDTLQYAERHGMATQQLLAEVRKIVTDIREDAKGNNTFERAIDNKLNGIISSFRADFPGRPESDYRLMSYIIAGFDATTISTLFNLSSNAAAHMRKARLKRLIYNAEEVKQKAYLRYF